MAKITYTNKVTGDTVSAADMNEIKSSVNTNDDTAIALAATVAAKVDKTTTVAGKPLSGNISLVKGDVGLGNVDNTSDASKPVSTAQATAIALKQDTLVSGTNIKTVGGVSILGTGNIPVSGSSGVDSVNSRTGAVTLTKADVGLTNVDNTADASKPISTAQQSALDLKSPIASPTFTGTVGGITKSMVGLGNVDNTADSAKPVSTAQATALAGKQDTLTPGEGVTIEDNVISAIGGVGPQGPVGPEGPIAVIEGEDLTILATRQQLSDATVIDYYTSEIPSDSGLTANLNGTAKAILQKPIEKDGIISYARLNNNNTTTFGIDIVTKNETGTGFTIVQSYAMSGVVSGEINEFKFLNIPVEKGQYVSASFDGNLKQAFFGDDGRGYWKSTDDYATSEDVHVLDFDFTYTVSAGIKSLVEEIVDAEVVQSVANIKTLSGYGVQIFNEPALTQINDTPVNGLTVYGVSIPIGINGILQSVYLAENIKQVRVLIMHYVYGKPYIRRILNIYSEENLESQQIQVYDDDYIVVDSRVNGGIYAKESLDTSYQLISYTLPTEYEIGDYVPQGDRSGISLGLSANVIKNDLVKKSETNGTVKVFEDDFSTQLPNWSFTGWTYNSGSKTYTSTGTGNSNPLQNSNDYWSDHRKCRSFWSFSSDCVWNYHSQLNGDNFNSKFQIDVPNDIIKIFAANNSTTVLASISVPLVADRDYCIEIEIKYLTLYFRVFDTLTGLKYECSYTDETGYNSWLEVTKYSFFCGTGSAVLKKEFSVSLINKPFATQVGDSITINTGPTEAELTYSRLYVAAVPDKKVTITALPGVNIGDLLTHFENEFKYTRPKYLTIMIGVNGGGTYKAYYQLYLLCRAFGINLILHNIPCALNNNNQITVAEAMGNLFNGADFAKSTAIDNDPIGAGVGGPFRGEPTKFSDNIHPNDLGAQSMFNRMLIDTPQLFED